MQEIRQTQIVEQNTLHIKVPEGWQGKEIEITIKQVPQSLSKKERFKKLLLDGPVWSEEEYQNYVEGKKHLEQWNKL